MCIHIKYTIWKFILELFQQFLQKFHQICFKVLEIIPYFLPYVDPGVLPRKTSENQLNFCYKTIS